MPHLISQKNFENITVSSLTTTSTSQASLDIFDKEQFRSARYQIQAVSYTHLTLPTTPYV